MYVDEGAGGSLGAIGQAMSDFAASAGAGQFAVNGHGGDALLRAIRNMINWINTEQNRLGALDQYAKLGGSNGAKVMSPYLREVATDERGLLTQLRQFRESLLTAEEGVKQAMANYRSTDQHNADGLA
ncbi:hypothetical protein [Actinokineospora sp. NBRC 105648]|uniref:hypothetical protein n=1 Tax=Actinokineospora sp. NBRC 105648 TaxID=3032206 RepID=UPI0024A2DB04|nr:hypothetical protein [Actinokineospora sp. NBRC 105648]GLZ36529.1 hypothetical protein Acsp05_01540 [Actinokineospora sp. NBRC 105648]